MRHVRGPGAVRYVTGAHEPMVYAVVALWCAGAVVTIAWLSLARWSAGPAGAGVAALAVSGWALARWARLARQPRVLLWTGAGWVLRMAMGGAAASDQSMRRVDVCVDLQRLLVLRCVAAEGGQATWLILTRAARARADWHLLRCALYAAAPEGAAR